MPYRALLSLLWLTLSACAILEDRPPPGPTEAPVSATDALSTADKLAAEGRWSEALALLLSLIHISEPTRLQ